MSNKMWSVFIVLENGRPAVLKDSKIELWHSCCFHLFEEAVEYAHCWCGKQLVNKEIENKDWFEGIDISMSMLPCVISIGTLLVPIPRS